MSLSNEQNCIFFNALIKNGAPVVIADVKLFQEFRDSIPPNLHEEYYNEKTGNLLTKIKNKRGDNSETWNHYYTTYITDILSSLKQKNSQEATEKVRSMLIKIEEELEGE